ncbi:unnamed protein product [Rhizophagus irregularis]|nr:unnamed protein product [Rhizophagus irregularis]
MAYIRNCLQIASKNLTGGAFSRSPITQILTSRDSNISTLISHSVPQTSNSPILLLLQPLRYETQYQRAFSLSKSNDSKLNSNSGSGDNNSKNNSSESGENNNGNNVMTLQVMVIMRENSNGGNGNDNKGNGNKGDGSNKNNGNGSGDSNGPRSPFEGSIHRTLQVLETTFTKTFYTGCLSTSIGYTNNSVDETWTTLLYRVGVFAQITSVFPANGGQDENSLTAVLYPHRRIRIKELIPPLTTTNVSEAEIVSDSVQQTAVDEPPNLKPPPQQPKEKETQYATKNQIVRAITSEIVAVFKDIATLNPLFRDQIANFSMSQSAGNVFEEPAKLADFAAAVSTGEPQELQEVLESLVIEERLQKALLVLKRN